MALRALQGPTGGGAPVGGGGTSSPSTIPRWTGPSTLGDSLLTQSGTTVIGSSMTGFGIGTTVSPWGAGRYALQVGGSPTSNIVGGSPNTVFGSNQYHDGTDARYINNGFAATYVQSAGEHRWSTAASGTAGAVATLTQYMVINSSGNVGIGTAGPGSILHTRRDTAAGRTNITFENGATSNVANKMRLRLGPTLAFVGTDLQPYVESYCENPAGELAGLAFGTFNGTALAQRWSMSAAGHFLAGADNSYDIGASGATRPRTVYVGTSVIVGPSATAAGANANAIGQSCTASASNAFAAGNNCTASAIYAVAMGSGNAASGQSAVALGQANTASGQFAMATGSNAAAVRYGQLSHTGSGFAALGDAQKSLFVALRGTVDATPTKLTLSGGALSSTTALSLPNNTAWAADVHLVARSATGAGHAYFVRRVLIKRDANAASTALVGTVQTIGTDIGSNAGTPPAGWAITITADTTNGALDLEVTGAVGTAIRWVARVEVVEVALA